MGIQIKHVVVVALVFAFVGFVYVMGFGAIDPRWPRAGAVDASPSVRRLVLNVRSGMVEGQVAGARAAGDELVVLYPQNPRSWLYRAYAYRDWRGDSDAGPDGLGAVVGGEELASWEGLMGLVDGWEFEMLRGLPLRNGLYLRGWGLRGLGRVEESRVDFVRLAEMYSDVSGIENSRVVMEEAGPGIAYNLACYWSMAGERELAIGYWRVSVEGGFISQRDRGGDWWRADPDFEPLWDEDRFWEIGEGGVGGGGGDVDARMGDE